MTGARGLTLVECLVGTVLSGVVLTATIALVVSAQRAAALLARSLDLHQNADAALAVLRAELQVEAGQLVTLADSAVVLRALRGAGAVCGADPAAGTVDLDASLFSSYRSIDPARDSVRIHIDGDPDRVADDRWEQFGVVGAGGGRCPGGASAVRLALAAGGAGLAGLRAGAPARIVEVVEYRSYRDAAGDRWLGTRSPSAGGWSASSPLAGPLAHPGGLVLRYLEADGSPTALADSVRLLELLVVARVAAPVPPAMRHPLDSAAAAIGIAGPGP